MIDTIYGFGQGLMSGIWPATVWPVLWALINAREFIFNH